MQIERNGARDVLNADVQVDLESIRHQLELGDTRIRTWTLLIGLRQTYRACG